MAVKFEKNTKRMSERFSLPAEVVIGKNHFQVHDWSMEGFSCLASNNEQLNLLKNYQGKITFILRAGQDETKIHSTAQARWQDGGVTGFQFTSLDDTGRQRMSACYKSLMNITESPFEPAGIQVREIPPATKSPIPFSETDKRALDKRFLKNSMLYGSLLLLLAIGTLVVIYFNSFVVVTHKAVMAAELTDVPVRLNGVIEQIYVQEGQYVRAHSPLYALSKDGVLREIQELKQSMAKQTALIRLTKIQLAEAKKAQGLYLQSARREYNILQAKHEALKKGTEQLAKEKQLYENSVKLGSVSKLALDQKETALQVNKAQMRELESELDFSGRNINSARNGLYYTSSGIKGNVAELAANIAVQNQALAELQARLNSLNGMQNDYVVKSPVSGYVTFVAPLANQYANAGDRIVSIAPQQNPPYVLAVFPSALESQLRPGHRVEVYSPLQNKSISGLIEHIYLETAPTHIKPALNEVAVNIKLDEADVIRKSGIKPFSNVLVRMHLNPLQGFLEKLGLAR